MDARSLRFLLYKFQRRRGVNRVLAFLGVSLSPPPPSKDRKNRKIYALSGIPIPQYEFTDTTTGMDAISQIQKLGHVFNVLCYGKSMIFSSQKLSTFDTSKERIYAIRSSEEPHHIFQNPHTVMNRVSWLFMRRIHCRYIAKIYNLAVIHNRVDVFKLVCGMHGTLITLDTLQHIALYGRLQMMKYIIERRLYPKFAQWERGCIKILIRQNNLKMLHYLWQNVPTIQFLDLYYMEAIHYNRLNMIQYFEARKYPLKQIHAIFAHSCKRWKIKEYIERKL